jgi:hypothetical protein
VVLIDTLVRATSGLDLNGPKDMGLVVSALDDIKRKVDCLAGSVYHSSIKASGASTDATEMGHSSFRGTLDASILVYEKDGLKYWNSKKIKDAASGEDSPFRFVAHQVRLNQWGNPKTSCAVVPITKVEEYSIRENNKAIEEKVRRCNLRTKIIALFKSDMEANGFNQSAIYTNTGGQKQFLVDTLRGMVSSGELILEHGPKNSTIYKLNTDTVGSSGALSAADGDF